MKISDRLRIVLHSFAALAGCCGLIAVTAITPAFGQGTTGTILGTVTDMTGASVPEATVQVRNTGTGVTQTASSDAQGRFRIADLGVGEYDVQASKTGFSTMVHKGITLNVGSQVVVDFALPVGQQQQTVTVEGQVSQVETTNSTVAALVDQRQMRELPLNGRNFEQLIQLAPGVATHTAFQRSGFQGRADQYSVAGARPEGQQILLDDENLVTYWNKGIASITGNSLGIEAIGEFQTLTNTFSAQFGGNGAVVNAVSKSGTNSIHGSAYEFLRNSAFDARKYFDNFLPPGVTASSVPPLRKNQFGGSIGGPIKKDKTFFFANYEGVRQLLGETNTAFVPDANHRTPTTTNLAQAQAIAATMAIYPLPDPGTVNAAGIGRSAQAANSIAHENYVLGRIDHNISEKDSIFGRYIGDKAQALEPFNSTSVLPYWGEQDDSFNQYSTIEWRRIISPTLVNVARVSFSRTTNSAFTTGSTPALQFFPGSGRQDGNVTITGISPIGGNTLIPFDLRQNRFTEADDMLFTHRSHSIRFGAAFSRLQSNTYFPTRSGGAWVFQSLSAFLAGQALTFNGAINSPAAYSHRDFRDVEFTPYIQDDWKVTPKLTLNLGLRWEFISNPIETHNQLWTITNFATDNAYVNVPHVMRNNPTLGAWNPRVGFAYDPFADHKTSIRGGFGIFRNPIMPPNYGGNYWGNKPWLQVLEQSPIYPTPFATNPTSIPPFTQPSGFDYNTDTTPYMIQYNLNVQRELVPGTTLSVGYVGSHGVHLLTQYEHNPPIPTIGSNGQMIFGTPVTTTNPQTGQTTTTARGNARLNTSGLFSVYNAFATITSSRYNSMQVALNRRFTRSTQVQVAYTWSHCLTNGGSWASYQSNGAAGESNPYNFNADWGPCVYDVGHALRVNGLYVLPFHANRLVQGWQLTGILTRSTGLPFNISNGFDNVGYTSSGTPRPDVVSGCNLYSPSFTWAGNQYSSHTVDRWFNPNCFSMPAIGVLGNAGAQLGRGPNFINLDMGLVKDTKVNERLNAQFRAEFFNLLNHPNFSVPASASIFTGITNGSPTVNSTAGQITSQVGNARQIQLALKLVF